MHSTVEGKYHWIRYWYHGLQLVSIDAYFLNISYLNWLLAMMVCNWLVLVLTHLLREALVRWLEMLISLSSNYSAYLLRPSVTFFFVQTSFIFFKFVSQHTWLGPCLSCLPTEIVFLAVRLFCIQKKEWCLEHIPFIDMVLHSIFCRPSTEAKSGTPKKKKHCNCRNSKCLKMWVLIFIAHTISC